MDFLYGHENSDLSSPLVWLFLLLLDHSIKICSPSGVARGMLPHTIFSVELFFTASGKWILFLDSDGFSALLHFLESHMELDQR